MGNAITVRTDEDTERALAELTADGTRPSGAVRNAVVDALPTCLVAPTLTSPRRASFRPEAGVAGIRRRALVEQAGAADGSGSSSRCRQSVARLERGRRSARALGRSRALFAASLLVLIAFGAPVRTGRRRILLGLACRRPRRRSANGTRSSRLRWPTSTPCRSWRADPCLVVGGECLHLRLGHMNQDFDAVDLVRRRDRRGVSAVRQLLPGGILVQVGLAGAPAGCAGVSD